LAQVLWGASWFCHSHNFLKISFNMMQIYISVDRLLSVVMLLSTSYDYAEVRNTVNFFTNDARNFKALLPICVLQGANSSKYIH